MCEFQESNCNGFGECWWTDKCIYFSSIDDIAVHCIVHYYINDIAELIFAYSNHRCVFNDDEQHYNCAFADYVFI